MSVDIDTDSVDRLPRYQLDRFEGPLDLLLFLIRKNELSIYDIPVAEITEQYLAYLKHSSKPNLDEISDFYLMAATLLNIKSKMLLPIDIDLEDDLDDPREELVRSLIEYEKFRRLTYLLSSREVQFGRIIRSKRIQVASFFPVEEESWEEMDILDLLKTFSQLTKSLGSEAAISIWEEVSINEKITLISEFLEMKNEFDFYDICNNTSSLMEVISAFLAVLELTKIGMINVLQNGPFENVRIIASNK
ncbi:Segregation and condensation protein A [Olavius algarvensis spirochete endosymbiont]|uniref:segregation and condensation protein A n=1 Tax=Olavius algarvensis spirochete endosymbiont TaxID=260710 RepID=UPI00068CDCCE|nr:segregation/condensation protein A [Olavius algarvensis spirochete endosymbiont]VDB00320.1 Segregation and condensation protein A [Olavius algarvensis spirochete endosymbiont]